MEVTISSTSCKVDTSIIPPCFKTNITAVKAVTAAYAHPLWQKKWQCTNKTSKIRASVTKLSQLSYPKASRWSRKPESSNLRSTSTSRAS